jgi:formate hydrogenlyase transcriptional activator
VAVAVENAIAFQEIETLKDQLAKENAYLEEEVRTEHNFGELIGASAALRRVLKEAETVAPPPAPRYSFGAKAARVRSSSLGPCTT